MKQTKYFKIYDWAGNDKTPYYGTFESFEDAWGRLYEEFDHLVDQDFDEQMSEFQVLRGGRPVNEANATLMAAAPEMLEALEMIQREITTTGAVKNSVHAVKAVNSAINTAKGGE